MEYKNPDIESSYRDNDLGKTLYDTVIECKPKTVIDFGVLYGYSTVAMALALDELHKKTNGAHQGKVIVYDLFEKYPHKHATKEVLLSNLEKYGVSRYIEMREADFYEWTQHPDQFDMLHLDISNKGDTIEALYSATKDQIKNGAVVLFEGGTKERDSVEWMVTYNQKKITECNAPYKVVNPHFPAISQLLAS